MRIVVQDENSFCHVMSVASFKKGVTRNLYKDGEGKACPAYVNSDDELIEDEQYDILPSEINQIPKWATHIIWYKKINW